MSTGLTLVAAGFVAGAFWWFLFEYVLHRWAFHAMRGVGIGSREHLEHHVKASWSFDWLLGLVWFGIALTGVAWGVAAGLLTQAAIGWGVGLVGRSPTTSMSGITAPRTCAGRATAGRRGCASTTSSTTSATR